MKSTIKYILFNLSFLFSVYVCAQTEMPHLTKNTFPIIYDSIPLNIIQNNRWQKGYEAFNNGQFEKAIKFYNSSLIFDHDDPFAIYNRALCYYKIHDVNRSCIDFKYSAYLGFQKSLNNYQSFCDSNTYNLTFKDSGLVFFNSTFDLVNEKNIPDLIPEFPGGIDSLYLFIIKNFRSSDLNDFEFKNERVLWKFLVNEDGKITDPTCLSPIPFFKKETLQLFSSMPLWKPAYENGKPKICEYIFPIVNGNAFNKLGNIHYNKGVSLLNENKLNESISFFNNALLFNIKDFDANYNRGISYYKMNDLSNACFNWGNAFLLRKDDRVINIINKYCDTSIIYNGVKTKITSLDFDPANTSLFNASTDGKIFIIVEEMPHFPGGDSMMFEFLINNLQYPKYAREKDISGKVIATFVVDKDGNIKESKILKGIGGGCDEEVIRLINSMPKWTPGKQNGKNVAVQYSMPFSFNLNMR